MEINQGDKVRVSSRVPRIYERFGSMIAHHYECKVVEIDDGMALLDSIPAKHIFLFPLKYLVKVDAEAKEPTAPTIKVGDRVRHKRLGVIVKICNIKDNKYIALGDGLKTYTFRVDDLELIQPKEQTEAEKQVFALGERVVTPYGCGVIGKDIEGKVAVVLESGGYCGIDKANKILTEKADTDWDVYTADLAKEIVLKVANKYNDPEQAAEYAVQVAKAVVKNLKNK